MQMQMSGCPAIRHTFDINLNLSGVCAHAMPESTQVAVAVISRMATTSGNTTRNIAIVTDGNIQQANSQLKGSIKI